MGKLTFGSLFAGIGGIDLGLERAGMVCEWMVEIDPFCLKVLEKHWPEVPKYEDVRDFPPVGIVRPDILTGGFPCQDVSVAGKRKGLKGERSGLWFEMLRVVRELEPRWVLVENVPGLLSVDDGMGFGTVLRDLAESGYDAEWRCLPASDFGAPHIRDRVFYWPTPRPTEAEMKARRPSLDLVLGDRSHGWDMVEALWDAAHTHHRMWPGIIQPGEVMEGGLLNPSWWEWLMGFPNGWTDLGA